METEDIDLESIQSRLEAARTFEGVLTSLGVQLLNEDVPALIQTVAELRKTSLRRVVSQGCKKKDLPKGWKEDGYELYSDGVYRNDKVED